MGCQLKGMAVGEEVTPDMGNVEKLKGVLVIPGGPSSLEALKDTGLWTATGRDEE